MGETEEVVKDFLRWVFTPTLAAKKAMDTLDDMLTGED